MSTNKLILIRLLFVFLPILIGCQDHSKTIVFCNHLAQNDSLSNLDYSQINFETDILDSNSFKLDTILQQVSFNKIDDPHLLDILNNNIVINGYQSYSLSLIGDGKVAFSKKLIKILTKNTLESNVIKSIDYSKYFPDTTFLINDFYLVGKLEFSKKFDSYVILNRHKTDEVDGFYFLKDEISYYLLNIDHKKKLISTIQLAFYETNQDGLSFFYENLKVKLLFKHRLIFVQNSYITSLDLIPPAENKQKSSSLFRITRKGEIKQN